MNLPMPVPLPTGSDSLPPLGGRLFLLYRAAWWALLVSAIAAVISTWIDPAPVSAAILVPRLAKSAVLITVSALLFRRRSRDPVAAMLSIAFLLWTVSSSIDFASATNWPAFIDRVRFLFFALALLLFPDGAWRNRWVRTIALAIVATFLLGIAESLGGLPTSFFLPIAIACVVAALAVLRARYRSLGDGTARQQLKWVTLGLFAGISLILSARAGAALTAGMAMPLIGSVLLEAAFQSGIIILALGFLVSLLKYRLYDAEAAISRSAIYAVLTLSLVAIFAACEALIELLGQRYLGSNIGSISGAVAAAIAAVLLTPLHGRITGWAEHYFQRDLVLLKEELPALLAALAAGSSVKRLAAVVLPKIEQAVQSTRLALLVDGQTVASEGIAGARAKDLLRHWTPAEPAGAIVRDDDGPFPLGLALRCPFGTVRGWLLLGPRPDGSTYGRDDIDALTEIAPLLQQTLFLIAEREADDRRNRARQRALSRTLASLSQRLAMLEENGAGLS